MGLASKQVARIGFSVLLARLLGPTNFGIVGQATIYLAFSTVFLDVGLASALIQRERIDRETIGTATWLNLGAVVLLVGLTQVLAGPWAALFDTPELESVLRVLSLDFVLIGLAIVPQALLTRRLNFRRLAMAEVAGVLVGGVVGVSAALAGAEYWSLVIQTLTTDGVAAIVVITAIGKPVLAWSRSALKAIFGFSAKVFGSQILRFFSQNADNTLIALRLGPTALANYALSYRVLLLPVQILSQTANRLVFPVLSRLNAQPERQAQQFLKVTASLSLAVTPPMLLVSLCARRGVPIVFGDEWDAAVRPMQILAVVSIVSAVVGVAGGVMLAKGRADWALRWGVVTTAFLIGGFFVGLNWGIDGVAWSYLLVGTPLAVVEIAMVRWLIPYTMTSYLRAIFPALACGVALIATFKGIEILLAAQVGDFWTLVVASLAAAAVFMAGLRLVFPKVLSEQIDFLKLMLTRRLGTPSVESPVGKTPAEDP